MDAARLTGAILVFTGLAAAQEPVLQWKALAQTILGEEATAQLERDRLVVLRADHRGRWNRNLRHVFVPYESEDPRTPPFLSTDSVLNAFHVLLEASMVQLEYARAERMGDVLEAIQLQVEEVGRQVGLDPSLARSALRRLDLVLRVAEGLLSTEVPESVDERAALVEAEVVRVEAARGRHKPTFLGPPDPRFVALDYERFEPRGFYTRSALLERYYRASRWLQSIPFRVDRDEELLAIWILSRAANRVEGSWVEAFFDPQERMFGRGSEGHPLAGGFWNAPIDRLLRFRHVQRDWLTRLPLQQFDGLVAEEPIGPSYRILPPASVPEAVAWRPGRRVAPGTLPPFPEPGGAPPANLVVGYLDCLALLAGEPEHDAPAFMRSAAWAAKSCQAILCSWTQACHPWSYREREAVSGGAPPPIAAMSEEEFRDPLPGFVEPSPRFYDRLCILAGQIRDVLETSGVFEQTRSQATSKPELRDAWRRLESVCSRLELLAHKQLRGVGFNDADEGFIQGFGAHLNAIMLNPSNDSCRLDGEASRIVTISTDRQGGEPLYAAIGRPHLLYLLYPWKDRQVLCRGVVLPYHEFAHPGRLDDAGWRALLDRGIDAPEPPEWARKMLVR